MNTQVPAEQCPTCGRYPNRGLSVDALIIRDGKILLGKRLKDPFKGMWALIGGYVEWNESAEDAVRREVREETGLMVTGTNLLDVRSRPDRHPEQAVTVAYVIEAQGDPVAGDDIGELAFYSLDALPELAFDHVAIIEKSLNGS